jgi:hypothetical protein
MTKQLQATLAAILVISAISVPAQTTTTPTTSTAKKRHHAPKEVRESATERQIRELREQMQNQQAEIDALKQSGAAKDAALAAAEQTAQSAQASAAAAAAQAQTLNTSLQTNADAVASLQGTVTDLKNSNTGLALTISDAKKDLTQKIENPSIIHYKEATIRPYGFAAAETVYRTRATNSDINTPFSATPYMNTAQAFTSEFNATGRQSRLGVLIDAPTSFGHIGAYYEMDFLSAGTTSNDNQTNSYTMRQREAWAQASLKSGFTVQGGQMWSLATETKKGIVEAPGVENLPNTIDPQYHVGFTFTRQYGARFSQQFNPIFAAAVSVEASQTILAGTTNAPTNFFFGAAGSGGGLYNSTANYSNNVAPDVIVKATADPKFGHFEIGGIARFFRDRYYPTLTYATTASAAAPVASVASNGVNDTVTGGGFFVNGRVHATKYADVGVHILQGAGTGRYGTSNLGDVTVKPNGTLEPLKNSQGLFSIETHPNKKLDVFGYAGGEYLQRTSYVAFTAAAPTTPVFVGYAPIQGEKDSACFTEVTPALTAGNTGYTPGAGSCSGHTRAVIEGTAGFIYKFYNSPTKGRLQYSMVYSYLTREAWTGLDTNSATGAGNPKATNNMVFTGFRYYIP